MNEMANNLGRAPRTNGRLCWSDINIAPAGRISDSLSILINQGILKIKYRIHGTPGRAIVRLSFEDIERES